MSETDSESGYRQRESEAEFTDAIEGEVERIDETAAKSGLSRLPLIIALVALLAVVLGLVLGYRYWLDMKQSLVSLNDALLKANQEQSRFEQQLQQTRQDFAQQQQAIAAQRDALTQQAEKIRQERESSRKQGDQLYRSLAEIQTRMGGKEGQWRVAEAEYLMRVANHRLNLMGDPDTALEALKSADERIAASGDPGWSEVREIIAKEVARLIATPKVDRGGISAELTALTERVDGLALEDAGVMLADEATLSDPPEDVAGNEGFQLDRLLDDFWRGFKSMMVIRHHDRPVGAMLPPEHRYFLLQNLRLKLENAKSAMMGRNQPLYSDNLTSAIGWIDHYFQLSDADVAGFRSQLEGLAAKEIAPRMPDISGSLRALQERRKRVSREAVR
ncbi:MAG: uroporphyrinogen-III C-methyltransferase [Candidatus Thiodiazotropha sp.]|nr:uroporphyrinogen-III C-methyltransferase [Candidatus Thiodiazotropha taylori]MBT3059804.1 uroporphyrinogen-III C-methyltransferase [Candidatus Thiodiazotropha sp. (ex Lucina pensylvanica)]MBV2094328.1 uroporphyrinogen-III C-methyltransferase [Candidatus Thiodiazotropha sp. (ex Codakia orbicularis)]PUB73003.1 MAG: HemX protein [gamma proteobacterium symbiont of Ctena orbiculata]MBT3063013.1 uroporphyrinogen-III C-methyltransferase [Candidatus Thiodiazotropha sp. (ex Lucina pensylvanica)]